MIKYVSSGSAPERQLLMQLLGKAPPPPHGYFESRIHQLAAVGELWVLVPNAPWGGKRGLVTQHWLLGKPVEPEPRPQPFFTPLFDKASDAIASVLSDLPPNLANRRWGVVLKHVGEKAYAASLPVVEGAALPLPESHFARDAQGVAQLPLRYQLDGIYLSSSTPEKLPVKEPRLYRNFFLRQNWLRASRSQDAALPSLLRRVISRSIGPPVTALYCSTDVRAMTLKPA
ncbi:hypothetical protein VRB78_02655 [Pseudomonas trivialis]|uniref:hypothetical protein n=1 Tax=Pseudomonas trivialis TaxID=200450 RepID=UPI0030D2C11D